MTLKAIVYNAEVKVIYACCTLHSDLLRNINFTTILVYQIDNYGGGIDGKSSASHDGDPGSNPSGDFTRVTPMHESEGN